MDFFVLTSSLPPDIKSLICQLNLSSVTIECETPGSHEEHYYVRKNGKLICEYLKHKHGPSLNEHTLAISFRNKRHRKNQTANTPGLKDLCAPEKKQELCELTKQIEAMYQIKKQHTSANNNQYQ